MQRALRIAGLALAVGAIALSCMAETRLGPRIPTKYFVTTGAGQSDEGIPPDPYETFSYDLALLDAGIENFNVVYYTSVLPAESTEVRLDDVSSYFHHGSVLEAILAKAGGMKGDTVAAGVGRVWAVDAYGTFIGGFAAEYEFVYERQEIAPDEARADAIAQLTRSLRHELEIRGLSQEGEMKFAVVSLFIRQNYGMALAALGFVDFVYPDPYPIDD